MTRPGGGRQRKIATIPLDPDLATVYAEGWQSWSVAGVLPVSQPPHRVTAPDSLVIDCQYAAVPALGVHQGSGLLAVDPGNGDPVEVFGACARTVASRLSKPGCLTAPSWYPPIAPSLTLPTRGQAA